VSEHPDQERWWKHRRRGYYVGLFWAVLQTPAWVALEIASPGSVASLGVIAGWSYGISATVIVSYFGNTAAETIITKGVR
jgi:hypothetical protein